MRLFDIPGVATYGRTWTKVAAMVGTRTAGQVRSHAQKFDLRLAKELQAPDGHHQGAAAAGGGGGIPEEAGAAGSSSSNGGAGTVYHSIGGHPEDGDHEGGSEGDSGEDARSPALKTKRGGGRPRGSTKEKGKQRKAGAARGKAEVNSAHPTKLTYLVTSFTWIASPFTQRPFTCESHEVLKDILQCWLLLYFLPFVCCIYRWLF